MHKVTSERCPISCRSTESQKASVDEHVLRVLWEHLAKGNSEHPLQESQQTALEASSESASSSKGIDAAAGRAEADKERTVQDIGMDLIAEIGRQVRPQVQFTNT